MCKKYCNKNTVFTSKKNNDNNAYIICDEYNTIQLMQVNSLNTSAFALVIELFTF